MPYYPIEEDSNGHKYDVVTYWEHKVAKYANISIFDVEELDYIDYLILRRDSFIYGLNKTESGKDYLDKAWMLEQTKPDRKQLRTKFKRGG